MMPLDYKHRAFNPPWSKVPLEQQTWRANRKLHDRLAIEIGAGVGLHSIQYAKQNPQNFLVSIERTTEKFEKFSGRAKHHPELTNLLPVHADAVQWISSHIQANEVDEYFILYPNPYPKAQQANKRFMHMPFMSYLFETMKMGAMLTLATNEQFYFEEAKAIWQEHPSLQIESAELVPFDSTPRTHFEKKYLARGESCYSLIVRKK